MKTAQSVLLELHGEPTKRVPYSLGAETRAAVEKISISVRGLSCVKWGHLSWNTMTNDKAKDSTTWLWVRKRPDLDSMHTCVQEISQVQVGHSETLRVESVSQ